MKPRCGGAVCAALMGIFISLTFGLAPAIGQAQRSDDDSSRWSRLPPPKKYKVSDEYLHSIGLAFGDMPAFPNKCYGDLSISDAFFTPFKARGFSLQALCLAITSPWITYDPETGKPLTVVSQGYLLQVPDCFRNGTPFLDCKMNFDTTGGTAPEARERALQVDAAVRKIIANGGYASECSCDDVRWLKDFNKFSFRRACRVDSAPVCMERMSHGKVRSGSFVFEEDGYSFENVPTKGATDYGGFDISPQFSRGYVYRIGSPEGDDDQPYQDLPPGRKIAIGPE
jgi:hypothetical protein